MSDLVEFLKARLDEDEQIAQGAVRWSEGASEWADDGEPDYVHIARHDPARVLADVEAKRRIIKRHHVRDDAPACTECGGFVTRSSEITGIVHHGYVIPWPCPTLRLLAEVYADHPDYREEWRL